MKKFNMMLCLILVIAMVMTGTARANYLINPGLEIGDPCNADPCEPNEPNDWSFWADTTGTTEAYVLYIEDDPSCGTDCGAHGGDDYAELSVYSYGRSFVFQQRFVAEDILYTLKAWARASAYTMPSPAEIKIEFYDVGNNLIIEEIENVDLTYDWVQYTNDSNGHNAPVGTRRITSTGANLTDAATAYYDDFELTSTPDFASLDDCQKTQFTDGFTFIQGDLTRNCLMDLRDVAQLALWWTKCNARDCADYQYGY